MIGGNKIINTNVNNNMNNNQIINSNVNIQQNYYSLPTGSTKLSESMSLVQLDVIPDVRSISTISKLIKNEQQKFDKSVERNIGILSVEQSIDKKNL